jgi:hypothetical protein
MNLFVRASTLALAALTLAACAPTRRPESVVPSIASEWTVVLLQVTQDTQANRYAAAERLLADFATRHPSSVESADASYWRALYRLDPANPNASPREAGALLDGYLASSVPGSHRPEAAVLRRIASQMESRLAAANAAAQAPAPTTTAADKAKDEELLRVKDELAKANAELERIKRRLTQPKP